MKILQKSFYISLPTRRLSATLIEPEEGTRGAMVIAMPLVEERKALMPPIMEAARLFADKNRLAVLRFDWAGTGDSSGNFADFGPEDWEEDLSAATAWLAERSVRGAECGVRSEKAQGCEGNKPDRACIDDAADSQSSELADGVIRNRDSGIEPPVEIPSGTGARGQEGFGASSNAEYQTLNLLPPTFPLFFLGIRTGALLLSSSSSPIVQNAPKIFWDPVGGSEVIRQWMQRHLVNDMVAYGHARTSRAQMDSDLASGSSIDLDGFEFTSRHQQGLSALNLIKSSSPTLIICTSKPSAATIQAFGEQSITLLRLPPYWNSVGYVDTAALRDATSTWIAKVRSEACGARREKAQGSEGNKPGRACIDDAAAASPSPEPADGVIGHQDSTTERIVEIPSGESSFARGILTVPNPHSSPLNPHSQRTILFLSGWSGDRQGPHRMFVQFARFLSENGVASLRLDYRGRGEGDGEHNNAKIATMADDAVSSVEWLIANGYAKNGVDVVAICSGCKVAITLATRAHIKHLNLLSAEAMGSIRAKSTNARKTLGALKAYIKKLFKAETWRKILKGEVRTDMVGKAIARHETRSAEEAASEDATLAKFKQFKGDILFIYGGSDPDAPAASNAYKRFCKRQGIKACFDLVPNAGHSYYGIEWTKQVLSILKNRIL